MSFHNKEVSFLILFMGLIFFTPSIVRAQTAQCGGSGGSSFIQSNVPNVNALMIYTSFPSGGFSGTDDIPAFASDVAEHLGDYYDEMSYNAHHVNVEIALRSAPNQDIAFVADNSLSFYQSGFGCCTKLTDLNTEILDKAWQDDNTVFNGIDVVFMFYGGNVFTGGTGWAVLNHNSTHYSGCGAIMEWGGFGSAEEDVHKWNMAHEYGHLLSPYGTSGKRLFDQTLQPGGIYNIMHNSYFNGTQPLAAFNLIHLGWIQSSWIKEIDPDEDGDVLNVSINDTKLAPSAGNYNVVRIQFPGTTNEHFIIENRQGTGFDANLSVGGKGLIIWHMNKSSSSYHVNNNMDVEIATAIGSHGEDWLDNGVGAGESRGFITDFFNAFRPNFAPWTNSSTETGYKYSGSHSFTDLGILDINAIGSSMTFDFAENSPPGPPKNLVISNAGQDGQNVILAWSANSEPDLDDYAIYRGYQDSETDPINWLSSPSGTTSNTTWTDPFVKINTSATTFVHYRITAVDDASNESEYSNSVSTRSNQVPIPQREDSFTLTEERVNVLPREFAIHQNYPNPFNPETQIRFDLPQTRG